MYFILTKRVLWTGVSIILIAFAVFSGLFFLDYQKKNEKARISEKLYRAIILPSDSTEKISALDEIVELHLEPYSSIAMLKLSDLYRFRNENDKSIDVCKKVLDNDAVDQVIKSIAKIRLQILGQNNLQDEVYYFVHQLVQILNDLENFKDVSESDCDVLKNKIKSLQDSTSSPKGIKALAKEFSRAYFSDY